MSRIFTAFQAFFGTLFNAMVAERVRQALDEQMSPKQEALAHAPKVVEPSPASPPKRLQSEAITLLATLQREARLVDFLKEDLSHYSDEQVGAAVREIHKDCGKVLDRYFEIRPILKDDEGAPVDVPRGFDAARYRLTGKLSGEAPFHGTLRHHGWEATRCELPEFTGGESAAKTIATAEVEVL